MDRHAKRTFTAAWLVASALLLFWLIALSFVPEKTLFDASEAFKVPHRSGETCALCGMTRAFAAIARGDFATALIYNRGAVVFYGALFANQLVVAFFLLHRMHKRRCHHAGA
ncbi:MAG: DUF2752 domain-containing protein [Candidatus Latescibacteria bacterium]|nr:DUF2752 domain-containing protein [Candidatus Latescibacterota bacterium]